ncbi:hypothetical protein GMES_2580 [Paraglaciecola mesophila KMM 241]|uniref:Uncharacterized protein n=1 Tax=Paraglaciecola mesophila KMM 241 TaxID=1128912 RepID=K6ZNF3_9ALTE|nr:hypothetical protein [Paraglaciecola mesophila]GAC24875.1 hypothetical protein GMES_2580 [Paraglaciecola mesophila KMM 241]
MSKPKKKLSAQEKGKLNAKKIFDWLATNPNIPLYQGKVNKTAICKQHGVPKSTIETNSELRELFEINGPIEELASKQKLANASNSQPAKEPVRVASDESTSMLEDKIDELEKSLSAIRLDLASEEFLLATGRYIPRLYNHFKEHG